VNEKGLAERNLVRSNFKCFVPVVVVELVIILKLELMSTSTLILCMKVDYLLSKLQPLLTYLFLGCMWLVLDLEERRML